MTERRSVSQTEEEEINLTPLLDCIFILVFFFLVATTLREDTRMEVRLPRAPVESSATPHESLRVSITADGLIFVGDTVVRSGELEEHLREATEREPEKPVEILADAEANMQSFVEVITVLTNLGLPYTEIRVEPASGGISQP